MTAEPPADETVDEPDSEETEAIIQEIERKRSLTGWATVIVAAIGIAFSLFQMWLAAKGFVLSLTIPAIGEVEFVSLQLLQINAIHVAFGLVLTFLLYPSSTGDGPISRRCIALGAAVDDRLGSTHPVSQGVHAVGGALRWLFVDPDLDRITPFDLALIPVAVLSAAYFVTDFREIQTMRALGLEAGRPIHEVFTFLDPVAGLLGPLTDISYAMVLGILGVLLVPRNLHGEISVGYGGIRQDDVTPHDDRSGALVNDDFALLVGVNFDLLEFGNKLNRGFPEPRGNPDLHGSRRLGVGQFPIVLGVDVANDAIGHLEVRLVQLKF